MIQGRKYIIQKNKQSNNFETQLNDIDSYPMGAHFNELTNIESNYEQERTDGSAYISMDQTIP